MFNVRKDLHVLYDGKMTVFGEETKEKDEYGITRRKDGVLYENIPCRLSYQSKNHNQEEEGVSEPDQTIRVYCDIEYKIPAGSKVVVTQYGQTMTYYASGIPAVYNSHQEIELTAKERA